MNISHGDFTLEEDLDFEISLYEDIIKDKPDLVAALIPLADAYTKKGMYEKGLTTDLRLAKLRPKDAVVHYNLACDYSILKDADKSLEVLEKAIKLGYRAFKYMEKDPDMEYVRRDARYKILIMKYRKK